ncbi:hypothetical protein TB2_016269 [Malus domestica]
MDVAGESGLGAGDSWAAPKAKRTAKRIAMRATTEDAFETAIVDRVRTSVCFQESRVFEDVERLNAQTRLNDRGFLLWLKWRIYSPRVFALTRGSILLARIRIRTPESEPPTMRQSERLQRRIA